LEKEFEKITDVVMEATFNRPWVADLATKCGLEARILGPKGGALGSEGDVLGEELFVCQHCPKPRALKWPSKRAWQTGGRP
jgi:hypothetical protein